MRSIVWMAWLRGDCNAEIDDRKRSLECGGRARRLDNFDGQIRSDPLGAVGKEVRVAQEVERS